MNKLSINNCLNYTVSEQDLNTDLQKNFYEGLSMEDVL